MSKDNQISMPGVFGGLMRYNEEYKSTFIIKPAYVIGFVIVLAVAIIALRFLVPIA